jgi:dimethylamine corrinoid protein
MIKMDNKEKILKDLENSVIDGDDKKAISSSNEAIANGVDAYTAISDGLAKGMEVMGEKYEKGTTFIPELLVASDAMYAGMDVLKPHLPKEDSSNGPHYRGVIGVMEGDTHDIGKNLVKTMLETAGFTVFDLGRDVPPKRFVETAIKEKVDIICLSSLMTTAVLTMEDVIIMLKREGIRDKVKVMVGGACVSPSFAQRIGADGYASNASAAVAEAKQLLNGKKRD